jgi:hypothetical protein|tara:strand:+ start:516 stop:791 length:276 start_codon:yes stop_codon:yes gene_type:complete
MSKNKVKLYATESVIEEFYRTLANNNSRGVNKVHIPKSDVFYVRRAIYDDTGEWYTLDHVERAMFVEGHLTRREVLDPNRKRQFIEGNEYF